MSPFDAEGLLAVLQRHRVDYVIVGGYAAQLHGAARPTLDIDITPDRAEENLARLAMALDELGATIRVQGIDGGLPFSADATSLTAMQMLNLETRFGELDLTMLPNGTEGYPDLVRSAEPVEVGPLRILIASLSDIIRSKEAAARLKDAEALPELYQLLAKREGDRS